MSEFMDRARAEAERKVARRREALWENEGEHLNHSWGQGFEKGFTEGAAWATEQEPTDAEIEAVARALFEDEVGPGNIAYYWGDRRDADLRQYWLDSARAVLIAAQKVRAGQ